MLLGAFVPIAVRQPGFPGPGLRRGVEAGQIGQLAQDLRRGVPLSQGVQPSIRVPLAEPLPVAAQQQGEVVEGRRPQPQQAVQQQLPGGGGQQIRAPHHLGDAHGGVVHHHSQLIGEHPVGATQEEVSAVPGQELPIRPHVAVLKGDLLLRHPQPQGRRTPRAAGLFGGLLWGQPAAGAGIDDLPVLPVGRAGGVELRPGAEAGIDQPLGLQALQGRLIQPGPAALLIGAAGAAHARSLVPVQAQPVDVPAHLLPVAGGTAGCVQVLDPQDHPAALLPGAEPGQQAAQDISQMDAAAGRGRESAHGLHTRCLLSSHLLYYTGNLWSAQGVPAAGGRKKAAARAAAFFRLFLSS